VTGLLERLVRMGILEKIALWRTKGSRHYFKHRSPLLSIVYYIDQRLGVTEAAYRKVDQNLVSSILGRELQFCLGEMLAEYLARVIFFHGISLRLSFNFLGNILCCTSYNFNASYHSVHCLLISRTPQSSCFVRVT